MPRANKSELIVRGSLIMLRRKCGTASCRCARGELHETPALTYSADGAKRFLTLRGEDVAEVKAALARYKRAATRLEREARTGVERLRYRIETDKARARRGR